MASFVDGTGANLDGVGVQLYPINGSVFGEIGLKEGDELTGLGKMLRLEYVGDIYDSRRDPAGFKNALLNPGEYSMQIGQKIWCCTDVYREELLSGKRPASQAGALINHASEGSGANCTWVYRQNKGNANPVVKMIDNLVYGAFFYFAYDGLMDSYYWKRHCKGLQPSIMPVAADAVLFFFSILWLPHLQCCE